MFFLLCFLVHEQQIVCIKCIIYSILDKNQVYFRVLSTNNIRETAAPVVYLEVNHVCFTRRRSWVQSPAGAFSIDFLLVKTAESVQAQL